jgi:hypothetical protein
MFSRFIKKSTLPPAEANTAPTEATPFGRKKAAQKVCTTVYEFLVKHHICQASQESKTASKSLEF